MLFSQVIVIIATLLCAMGSVVNAQTPQERAAKLLSEMTLDEQLAMVRGYDGEYVGVVIANNRLGIPQLNLEDGPQGVGDGTTKTTCWPSALTVVASWDAGTMHHFAQGMAKEQRMKGTNVMLGPMINIARVPFGGRNFESFGEDPYLTSVLVDASVKGIQSQGVIGCAKHYVDNNQELNRTLTSANVPARAQWEIYYPGFQAAVNAGVGSIMCSYNRINDTYACENDQTLNVDLKGRMGFQGWVMSDWGATHSTVKAANSGLDMQMPDDSYFGAALKQAVQNGQVPVSRINDMVMRILVPMFSVGLFDTPQTGNLSVDTLSRAHDELARHLAEAGTVLLKNDAPALLPLKSSIKTIAVIGDDAQDAPIATGEGSGYVIPPYIITPLQGITNRAGSGVKVTYANTTQVDQAVSNAKAADVAIVFVAVTSSEGIDRTTLSLGSDQDDLVTSVVKAQPNTIVVVHAPGAVLMPWVNQVSSIVCAFMPGQEDGNAIAGILFGDVNPGGKLPLTFPVSDSQTPVNTPIQYPGIDNEADYSEELLVGYRWYDAKSVTPLFPFGHGLSYTTFTYTGLTISGHMSQGGVLVRFNVTNTGSVFGQEVAQVYLGYPAAAGEPPKNLRYFRKLSLQPGQASTVNALLTPDDISIWDVVADNWTVVSGTFRLYIGSSSRDIRMSGYFTA